MVRRTLPAVLVAAAILVGGLALLDEGSAQTPTSPPGQPVLVVNLPKLQPVEVKGIPSQATLVAYENQLVSPSSPGDPGGWRVAGALDSDGFGWVVLSLGGDVQGTLTEPGGVVAVLVPDQEPVLRALREDRVLLFPIRVTATLVPGREYFTSMPERVAVSFPRYRVYLYNTGTHTVQAHLYAYLGN